MSWIRRETEKGTVQYICPRCHDYHEFREDFGERTFSENYIFCRRCGARNGTGNAPTLTQPPITGDTSDGYHTFNELYHHRAILFSVICNERPEVAWKSRRHHDGTMYDGMFIVGIDTPEGQATYHYDIDPYWNLFRVKELELAPEWDGHTSGEAIRRIGTLTQPNEPLTLEQLREMKDEPAYLKFFDPLLASGWHIIKAVTEDKIIFRGWQTVYVRIDGMGIGYNLYRRPPEGEEKI